MPWLLAPPGHLGHGIDDEGLAGSSATTPAYLVLVNVRKYKYYFMLHQKYSTRQWSKSFAAEEKLVCVVCVSSCGKPFSTSNTTPARHWQLTYIVQVSLFVMPYGWMNITSLIIGWYQLHRYAPTRQNLRKSTLYIWWTENKTIGYDIVLNKIQRN